jgi:CRISPR/Cas system-associated exonuclease Cas4 (RecB family)
LKHLHLEKVLMYQKQWGPGWDPLLSYLAHQTSDGQRISVTISERPRHICRDVVDEMRRLVEKLVVPVTKYGGCPCKDRHAGWFLL